MDEIEEVYMETKQRRRVKLLEEENKEQREEILSLAKTLNIKIWVKDEQIKELEEKLSKMKKNHNRDLIYCGITAATVFIFGVLFILCMAGDRVKNDKIARQKALELEHRILVLEKENAEQKATLENFEREDSHSTDIIVKLQIKEAFARNLLELTLERNIVLNHQFCTIAGVGTIAVVISAAVMLRAWRSKLSVEEQLRNELEETKMELEQVKNGNEEESEEEDELEGTQESEENDSSEESEERDDSEDNEEE
ncbi:hypothetical protein PFISCL1PPCAC_24721 [Pristionchus fissidentatus]|uniref:Uncharacterized protein n=1 Tax=Pristionchus fissidentatus TaxID=1538716 RepID=A0AAV5WMR6_9BILA|nr:hypothetical protein PFISCL1PPCAC_24721 [Pristionchus fissidentatus]